MSKIFFLLLTLTLITACQPQDPCAQAEQSNTKAASTASCNEPTPTPDPKPDPIPGDDVPQEALIFDANLSFVNFEAEQEEKVHMAVEIIKKVIQSSEFRSKVLNYTYNGKRSFIDNKGLSNDQIYQILLDASEDLLPEVDHQMDLELELYSSWSNTVGYTYPNVLKIWMNTKYFNVYTPSEVAGNIFHEWTHKLGFEHAQSYSESRDHSVPYAIGYLIRDLGKKYQ